MTEESAIELISLVKQFPLLYDRSHPLYNNSAAKSNAWKEVAKGCKLKGNIFRHLFSNVFLMFFSNTFSKRMNS